MSIPVILDVDTGIDDALAILFAVRHPGLEVLGISCVAGNASLAQVVDNTLRVLDAADAPDLPVAAGAVRPLLEPARAARHVHGLRSRLSNPSAIVTVSHAYRLDPSVAVGRVRRRPTPHLRQPPVLPAPGTKPAE